MIALHFAPARLLTIIPLVLTLTLASLVGMAAGPATPRASALVSAATGDRVGDIAWTRRGSPYQYGAAGPRRFDCSGLTRWVYARVGKSLPHSSRLQVRKTTRISRSSARRGDLVFFYSRSGVYHVGIKARDGYIWHAPKPGTRVRKDRIWTSKVFFGRVR
ncbi:MAG: C40 family peptidase [Actinomycetes bacterium]